MLLDADPMAFLAWFQVELGQFTQLLNNVSDLELMGLPSPLRGLFKPSDVII